MTDPRTVSAASALSSSFFALTVLCSVHLADAHAAPNGFDPHAVECFKQVIQVGASVWRRKPAADGPPLSGPSQLPRVCPRESKADPVEPAFRQAHGLNALRPLCRIGCFLARWFGRAHCRLCQALAFIAFRRYFHNSSLNRSLGWGPLDLCRAYLGIREREVFEGDSQ